MKLTYLNHEEDSVHDDQGHDKILKRCGNDDPPDAVLDGIPVSRHIPLERFSLDCKVDAGFLKEGMNEFFLRNDRRLNGVKYIVR